MEGWVDSNFGNFEEIYKVEVIFEENYRMRRIASSIANLESGIQQIVINKLPDP